MVQRATGQYSPTGVPYTAGLPLLATVAALLVTVHENMLIVVQGGCKRQAGSLPIKLA